MQFAKTFYVHPASVRVILITVRVYVDVVNTSQHEGARMTLVSPAIGVQKNSVDNTGASLDGAADEAAPEESQQARQPPGKRRRKSKAGK